MATAAKEWKKANKAHELTLPSGNVCLVKRPGPQAFVTSGTIPNSLLGIIMPLLEDAQKKGAEGDTTPVPDEVLVDLQKTLMDDPERIADMMTLIDNITVTCVVEPRVLPVPVIDLAVKGDIRVPERDPEALYVDEVDFEDKAFIMNFAVGGTADLERFREGAQASLDLGQAGEAVLDPPQ